MEEEKLLFSIKRPLFCGSICAMLSIGTYADPNTVTLQSLANTLESTTVADQQSAAFQKIVGNSITPEAAEVEYQSALTTAQNSLSQAENVADAKSELANNGFSTLADEISQSSSTGQSKDAQGLIEFISLGMPVASLRQILTDAAHYNIPVVIRGILQNNWTLTSQTIFNLVHPQGEPQINSGVEIDPLWFREFHVDEVPALVAVNPNVAPCEPDDKTCSPSFDVVYGNISIQNALNLIAERGEVASAVAKDALGDNPND